MAHTHRNHPDPERIFWGIPVDRLGKDVKPGQKPASWFKRLRRRIRRAKIQAALRAGREIPIFKKDDEWDWN